MQSTYGTQGKDIWAIIGPGISLEHFEVGDEVYEQFEKAGFRMGNIAKRYPCSTNDRSWKWHIDLWACNRMQMEEMGVLPEQIQVTGICTYTQYKDYFSARRLGINSGRIFTGIMMK
jgi:copper oxidase (laccase) domain-containing protein